MGCEASTVLIGVEISKIETEVARASVIVRTFGPRAYRTVLHPVEMHPLKGS